MSAAPVYPARPRPRPVAPARPAQRPHAKSEPFLATALSMLCVFALTAVVTYGFSTLLGQSMKESARHEAIRAGQRAKAARADMGRIRSRVERLATLKAVDDWARAKGFVNGLRTATIVAVATPKPAAKDIVARNDKLQVDVVVAKVENGAEAR